MRNIVVCILVAVGALTAAAPGRAAYSRPVSELYFPPGMPIDRADELRHAAYRALKEDDWQRARRIAREWAAIDPDNDFPWILRAWADAERNDYVGVVAAYNRALDLNPDQRHPIWRSLGVAYTALQRYDYAVTAYRRAAEVNAAEPYAWLDLCEAHLRNADPQHALDAAQHAIQLEDDYAEAWACRGQALSKLNRLDDALLAFRKAIDSKTLDPSTDRVTFWISLGWVYHRLNSEQGMREAVEGISHWNPEVAERFRQNFMLGGVQPLP